MKEKGFFGLHQVAQRVEGEDGILHAPHREESQRKMPKLAFITGQIGLQKA
jgi:hypothetical protein